MAAPTLPTDPVFDPEERAKPYDFGPGFQQKIIALAVRGDLLVRAPGAFQSRFFGISRFQSPRRRLAEIVEKFAKVNRNERPGVETMDELVRREAATLKPIEREVFEAEWMAVRSVEIPDPNFVIGEVRGWAKDAALSEAIVRAADAIEASRRAGKQDSLADIRRMMDEALAVGEPEETANAPKALVIPAEEIWDEPDEPVEWDVTGLLVHGSQGWFSGAPKHGKSFFTIHLASRLAAGKPVLDSYPVPAPKRVLMVQVEDPRRRVKGRLKQLTTREEREGWQGRFRMVLNASVQLDDSEWQQWIRRQIQEHKAEVLILDVWRWLHSADTNSEKELKPILRFLTKLCQDFNLTIIIVTHDSKPKQGPEGNKQARRITGNWSQWAWANFGWFFAKHGRSVQVAIEGKDVDETKFAFRFQGGEDGVSPVTFAWQPPKMTAAEERRWRMAEHMKAHPGRWFDLEALKNEIIGLSATDPTLRRDLEVLCRGGDFEESEAEDGPANKRAYRHVDPWK